MVKVPAGRPTLSIEVTLNVPTPAFPISWEDATGVPIAAPVTASLWIGGDAVDGDDLSRATEYPGTVADGSTFTFDLPALDRVKYLRLVTDGAVKTVGSIEPKPLGGGISGSTIQEGPQGVRLAVGADGMLSVIEQAFEELLEGLTSQSIEYDEVTTPGKDVRHRRHFKSSTTGLLTGTTSPTQILSCNVGEFPAGRFLRFYAQGFLVVDGAGRTLTLAMALGGAATSSPTPTLGAGTHQVALRGWIGPGTEGGMLTLTTGSTPAVVGQAGFTGTPSGSTLALTATLSHAGMGLVLSQLTVVPSKLAA